MGKTWNLVFMVLMGLLAVHELYRMTQEGVTPTNVLFFVVFTAFTVRRVLLHQKLA